MNQRYRERRTVPLKGILQSPKRTQASYQIANLSGVQGQRSKGMTKELVFSYSHILTSFIFEEGADIPGTKLCIMLTYRHSQQACFKKKIKKNPYLGTKNRNFLPDTFIGESTGGSVVEFLPPMWEAWI